MYAPPALPAVSGFLCSCSLRSPPTSSRRSRLPARQSALFAPPTLFLLSPRPPRDLVSLPLSRPPLFPSSRPDGLDWRSPPPRLSPPSSSRRPASPSPPAGLSPRFEGLRRRSLSLAEALGEPERERAIPTDATPLRGARLWHLRNSLFKPPALASHTKVEFD